MKTRFLIGTGGLTGGLALLCCVTPVLPFVLTALGAGSLIAYVVTDAVLLPLAGAGFLMMGVGFWLKRKRT